MIGPNGLKPNLLAQFIPKTARPIGTFITFDPVSAYLHKFSSASRIDPKRSAPQLKVEAPDTLPAKIQAFAKSSL